MVQPSHNPGVVNSGLSLPSRPANAPFHAYELSTTRPLAQMQGIDAVRPVVMVGEGSHRTHEFFELQAGIAQEAIEQGCRHLFLEVPCNLGAELNDVLSLSGCRHRVEELIQQNFYCTWSDRSFVELLQKMYDLNQLRGSDPIVVHGIDPQVYGVPERLNALSATLHGRLSLQVQDLASTWASFDLALRQYCNHLDDERFLAMQGPRAACVESVQALINQHSLTRGARRLLDALLQHLKLYSAPQEKSIEMRDRMMAERVTNILPLKPPEEPLKAPLAVVLAHNAHVSFGPRGEAGGWFADGIGSYVREELSNRGFSNMPCTVLGQLSIAGSLGFLPRDPDSLSRSTHPTHDSMIDGQFEHLPASFGGKSLLVHCTGMERDLDGAHDEITVRQYGRKDPRESAAYTYRIKPAQHMTFFALHVSTSAAAWVSHP